MLPVRINFRLWEGGAFGDSCLSKSSLKSVLLRVI